MYESLTMTEAEKDALSTDEITVGLTIFCTDTNKLYIYIGSACLSVQLT